VTPLDEGLAARGEDAHRLPVGVRRATDPCCGSSIGLLRLVLAAVLAFLALGGWFLAERL
jgi:hypothetical protein